jgi:LPS sulfotransferase NodH
MPTGDSADAAGTPGTDVDLAVIVGSPRSGTTWVQRLIGSHPEIASPPETHAFHWYLGPALDRWREFSSHMDAAAQVYERSGEMPDRLIGLQTILSTEDFLAWSRSLIGVVQLRAFEQKPQARILLEKTPSNSRRVHDIDLLFPQSRFVHVVRDGRDVAASLLAASGSWGTRWAPRDPSSAARVWRSHVRDAERAAAFGDRYLAVRYEDLRRDPVAELQRVLSFLGVSATEEHVEALTESSGGEVLAGDARRRFGEMPPEPAGFRSSSERRLPDVAIAEIEKVAGDVLRRYGYELTQTGPLTRLRGEVWCAVAPRVRKAPLRRRARKNGEHRRVGRR